MASIPQARLDLYSGQRMDRAKFLRLWDHLPDLKRAELIDGVVYVASPVSTSHSDWENLAGFWLRLYQLATPGTLTGNNGTWFMLDSAPQPDAYLCVAPEFGGQAKRQGDYLAGPPDLAVEISVSSNDIDFGPKLALYARAGVREYITFEPPLMRRVFWRRLVNGSYRIQKPDANGLLHSHVFPGLCLHPEAFWEQDGNKLRLALETGCATPAHAAFVKRLARRRA